MDAPSIMTKDFSSLQGEIHRTRIIFFAGDMKKGNLLRLLRMRSADIGTVVA